MPSQRTETAYHCTCLDYCKDSFCKHQNGLAKNKEMKLRIQNVLIRTTTLSNIESEANNWEVCRILYLPRYEYAACFIFRRVFDGKVSSSVALVMFDCRRKRLRTALKN